MKYFIVSEEQLDELSFRAFDAGITNPNGRAGQVASRRRQKALEKAKENELPDWAEWVADGMGMRTERCERIKK